MIPFITILEHYESSLHKKYSAKLLPGHLKAISAIKRCRTALSGEFHVQCIQGVVTLNGTLNPVDIVAALSVRIMRLRNG